MTCQLKAIVAVCDDWGIGHDGDMVVSNRADMRHFVTCTKGHPVIMGRKTLESFPGGRPLKDRRNIVLTRDGSFAREGVEVVHSVDEALTAVADEDVAWVIGGGAVYEQLLPYCVEAEVTRNHVVHPADTFFPNLDEDAAWIAAERQGERTIEEGQGDAGLRYEFVTYRKVSS
ncbi:dihydrofolate reductase [Collinsella stercoris]|uniref:dihydrofolate reductase n=1 Tax=Collinsella stercoris TaxID=147206 RepID=UPI003AEFF827